MSLWLCAALAGLPSLPVDVLRPHEAAEAPADGGLPRYVVDLKFDVQARRLSGTVLIGFTPSKSMPSIDVRVAPNAVHENAVRVGQPTVDGRRVRLERPDGSLYVIQAAQTAGQPLALAFDIGAEVPEPTNPLPDRWAFGAFGDFVSLAGLVPRLSPHLATGLPVSAQVPLSDHGTFEAADWLVSLTVTTGYRVLSAGIELGEVPDPSGGTRYTFAHQSARDVPLWVVRGYTRSTREVRGITVESWAAPGHSSGAALVLELASQSLAQLDQHLTPYPYRTFRIVEAPLTAEVSGLAFAGAVGLSSRFYSQSTRPPALRRQSLEMAVAHEVAHQWAGMLVGNDVVDEPWADEPLAQHLALLAIEWSRGKKAAATIRSAQLALSYQAHRLAGGADGPVQKPCSDYADALEYAAFMYGKAPLLFDAQRKLVGDAVWLKALTRYFSEFQHTLAPAEAFEGVLEAEAASQASALARLRVRWLEEAHGDADVSSR